MTRGVPFTRFGGPKVPDVVDAPGPESGDGQKLYDVSTAGINYADTHQRPQCSEDGYARLILDLEPGRRGVQVVPDTT